MDTAGILIINKLQIVESFGVQLFCANNNYSYTPLK